LDPEEGEIEFTGHIVPPEPSLDAFGVVLTQDDRYLAPFWLQFGNSLYIGVLTMLLTLLIASLASFAVGRMRLDKGGALSRAAAVQRYLRIYLPLMAPALAVVAIYALVLAWNDYLYQLLLLSSPGKMTVALLQGHLFEDPDAAWNAMMAAAIIYALPPIVIFY